ncbi:MAG: hypothetical protein HXM94_00700 [Parvimonas micra]|uniref:Uncharacterized protein n=1 Tax=Parvimonas micra TaxID=33033 RepID=A0A930H5G6_9FIRM|nr:hypothetical protein [Parvimonas micra]MBF1306293.1 hypothetical protein [Parvimonas micra]
MIDLKNKTKTLSISADLVELFSLLDSEEFSNQILDLVIKNLLDDRDFTLFWNRFDKTVKVHFISREVTVEPIHGNDFVSWIPIAPHFDKKRRENLLNLQKDRESQLLLLKEELRDSIIEVQNAALYLSGTISNSYLELEPFYNFYKAGFSLPIDLLNPKARASEIYSFCEVLSPYECFSINELVFPEYSEFQDNKKFNKIFFDSNFELFDFYKPFESELFEFLTNKMIELVKSFEEGESFYSLDLLIFYKLFKALSSNLGKIDSINVLFSNNKEAHEFLLKTLANLRLRVMTDQCFAASPKLFDLKQYGIPENLCNEVRLSLPRFIKEQYSSSSFLTTGILDLKSLMKEDDYIKLRFDSNLIIPETFSSKLNLESMHDNIIYSPFIFQKINSFAIGWNTQLNHSSFVSELEKELIAHSALTTKEVKDWIRTVKEEIQSGGKINSLDEPYLNHLDFVLQLKEIN